MNIYIGNLSYTLSDDELRGLFEEYGEVKSASIIKDQTTGQSKGFGFVEMENQAEAEKAIEQLNQTLVKDRKVTVNQARPRAERPRRQW